MNTFKLFTTTAITCSVLSIVSFNSYAMDKYIENALIDVCKSTLTNNVNQFQKTADSYNLRNEILAMKVMCNGEDIISFAQKYGANKTAARLQRSVSGNVKIIDVAKIEKIQVNFQL